MCFPLFHFVPAAVEVLLHATSVARHEDVQVAVERFVLDLARLCSQKKYSYRFLWFGEWHEQFP